MKAPRIATREAWLEARRTLLEEEKALTKARDAVAAQRRELPWVLVDTPYVFADDAGTVTLRELFGEREQLIVQHFMYGEDWTDGCPSCSFWSDNLQGALPHLAARGVAFASVSEAPVATLHAYRARMGWQQRWVSCGGSSFGRDYLVHYSPEELAAGDTAYNFEPGMHYGEHAPGFSVFARDGDDVYHTYSVYARGLDALNGTYQLLDLLPGGRDEDALPYPMAWVRRHDEY